MPLGIINGIPFSKFTSQKAHDKQLTEKQAIAFQCFTEAHLVNDLKLRFLLLVITIEALSIQTKKSEAVQDVISECMDNVKQSEKFGALPVAEQNNLIDGITRLKTESIRQVALNLIETHFLKTHLTIDLPNGKQEEMPAKQFFDKCYKIRSQLVHDGQTGISFDELQFLWKSLSKGDFCTLLFDWKFSPDLVSDKGDFDDGENNETCKWQ